MGERKRQALVKNWVKTRKTGKRRYVVKQSILWGIVTYLLFNGIKLILSRDYPFSELLKDLVSLSWWINFLLLMIIGGPIYGLISWYLSERAFKKILKDIKRENELLEELET